MKALKARPINYMALALQTFVSLRPNYKETTTTGRAICWRNAAMELGQKLGGKKARLFVEAYLDANSPGWRGGSPDPWQYWFSAVRDRLKGVAKEFFLLTGVRFKALFYRELTPEELAEKRKRAYERVLKNINRTLEDRTTTALSNRYERDAIVGSYVLGRAKGICELCGKPAHFNKAKDGSPYLETHHVILVSEDGPDHPKWVAAVHAECHKNLHFGIDHVSLNEKLKNFLASIEINQAAA